MIFDYKEIEDVLFIPALRGGPRHNFDLIQSKLKLNTTSEQN
jgi:hypothetical protein